MIACSGTSLDGLVNLARALKERLNDSQSNLKPLASRLLGSILSFVDADAQARLGKIVFPSLVNAAMNDNKKIMSQSSLEAVQMGIKEPEGEGSAIRASSLEALVGAFVACVKESEYKVSPHSFFFNFCLLVLCLTTGFVFILRAVFRATGFSYLLTGHSLLPPQSREHLYWQGPSP
jgi:hypothetical protein